MQLERILLTTDLSEASLRAFEPLAALARSQGAAVTLLHVVEDKPVIPHGAPMAPRQSAPEVDDAERQANAWLAEQGTEGIADTVVIRAPKVAEAIVEFARAGNHDLIAMSTHGHTGFRHLILGSVAEAVIRHADRPVLVFPRPR